VLHIPPRRRPPLHALPCSKAGIALGGPRPPGPGSRASRRGAARTTGACCPPRAAGSGSRQWAPPPRSLPPGRPMPEIAVEGEGRGRSFCDHQLATTWDGTVWYMFFCRTTTRDSIDPKPPTNHTELTRASSMVPLILPFPSRRKDPVLCVWLRLTLCPRRLWSRMLILLRFLADGVGDKRGAAAGGCGRWEAVERLLAASAFPCCDVARGWPIGVGNQLDRYKRLV